MIYLLVVFLFNPIIAQTNIDDYNVHCTLYTYYKNTKQYKKSIFHYKQLKKYNLSDGNYYVWLQELYLLNQQKRKAYRALFCGIRNGLSPEQFDREIENYKQTKYYNKLLKIKQDYYKNYLPTFFKKKGNIKKQNFINELLTTDQNYRNLISSKKINDTICYKLIDSIDHVNLKTLLSFYKNQGFIYPNELETNCHYEVLILHLLRCHNATFDSIIKANMRLHNLHSDIYVFYKEQEEFYNGKKSYYYTNYFEEISPNYYDLMHIDSLRMEIGYWSIYQEYFANGNVIPGGYKINENEQKELYKYLKK